MTQFNAGDSRLLRLEKLRAHQRANYLLKRLSASVPKPPPVSPNTVSAAVAPAPTTTAPPAQYSQPVSIQGSEATDGVTPEQYAEWSAVNVCEEGGNWGYAGPEYPDGLGISAINWAAYGGTSDLSPDAQIIVAENIEASAGTPGYVPDQGGCNPGGW